MQKYSIKLIVKAEDLTSLIKHIEESFPEYISVDVSSAD